MELENHLIRQTNREERSNGVVLFSFEHMDTKEREIVAVRDGEIIARSGFAKLGHRRWTAMTLDWYAKYPKTLSADESRDLFESL